MVRALIGPLLILFSTAAMPRQFEVASIKPSKPGAVVRDMRIALPPGRFEAMNITLNELLLSLSGFTGEVRGASGWMTSERYDIVAKADGVIAPEERDPMVMALLKDRFRLVVHHVKEEQPALALTAGKKPPKLEQSKEGNAQAISGGRDRVVFRGVGMFELAGYLTQMLHTRVVDRAGMNGRSDFAITPENFVAAGSGNFGDLVRAAIKDLGFRLEQQNIPVDVIVIDHAERPSPN